MQAFRASVCVFCGARPGRDPGLAEAARATGAMLARNRWRLVFGAGDIGLMGEVARSTRAAGGACLGVIPQHLISNDNKGIAWDIPGSAGFRFNKLAFFLTDLNDAGILKFRISADGTVLGEEEVAYIGSGAPADDLNNAALHLVTMSFSQVVGGTENIRIELLNTTVDRNDGFGIDGIVAAIPLPAAGWLLLAAFGGLGVAARRKRKIAA